MGSFHQHAQQFRWIHHQHGFPTSGQNGLLECRTHGWIRFAFLPHVAQGYAENDCNEICCISSRFFVEMLYFESQDNEYIQSVGRCLQMMLRIDEYRYAFVAVDGVSTLVQVLAGRHNFQIQYQLTFCIWVLTFNSSLAEKMNK